MICARKETPTHTEKIERHEKKIRYPDIKIGWVTSNKNKCLSKHVERQDSEKWYRKMEQMRSIQNDEKRILFRNSETLTAQKIIRYHSKNKKFSSFCRIDHFFFLILVRARSQIRRTRKVIWDGRRLHQSSMRTFFWSTLLTVFLRDVLASCKLYEQNTHQSWICQTIRLSFQFVRPFFLFRLDSGVVDAVRLRDWIENKMKF